MSGTQRIRLARLGVEPHDAVVEQHAGRWRDDARSERGQQRLRHRTHVAAPVDDAEVRGARRGLRRFVVAHLLEAAAEGLVERPRIRDVAAPVRCAAPWLQRMRKDARACARGVGPPVMPGTANTRPPRYDATSGSTNARAIAGEIGHATGIRPWRARRATSAFAMAPAYSSRAPSCAIAVKRLRQCALVEALFGDRWSTRR